MASPSSASAFSRTRELAMVLPTLCSWMVRVLTSTELALPGLSTLVGGEYIMRALASYTLGRVSE